MNPNIHEQESFATVIENNLFYTPGLKEPEDTDKKRVAVILTGSAFSLFIPLFTSLLLFVPLAGSVCALFTVARNRKDSKYLTFCFTFMLIQSAWSLVRFAFGCIGDGSLVYNPFAVTAVYVIGALGTPYVIYLFKGIASVSKWKWPIAGVYTACYIYSLATMPIKR